MKARSPFLVCMSHAPDNLLPMLQPLRVQAATMQSPFRVFHSALLYLHVTVMARFLFHGLCLLVLTPLPVPLFTLKLDCPAGWWPMPFRVCLISICFFFLPACYSACSSAWLMPWQVWRYHSHHHHMWAFGQLRCFSIMLFDVTRVQISNYLASYSSIALFHRHLQAIVWLVGHD